MIVQSEEYRYVGLGEHRVGRSVLMSQSQPNAVVSHCSAKKARRRMGA